MVRGVPWWYLGGRAAIIEMRREAGSIDYNAVGLFLNRLLAALKCDFVSEAKWARPWILPVSPRGCQLHFKILGQIKKCIQRKLNCPFPRRRRAYWWLRVQLPTSPPRHASHHRPKRAGSRPGSEASISCSYGPGGRTPKVRYRGGEVYAALA